ncbi:hypothetical protein HanLR1_Chr00c0529g0756691 [Helianthus annuus]|nr:hypothetical protein HanLR1_Chr00c0529g0756691 [Helianthus annuus]
MRSPLESLMPGIELHILVISAGTELRNYEERFRQKGSITGLLCSVNMLNENDYRQSEETRSTTFAENMGSVLLSADVKNICD